MEPEETIGIKARNVLWYLTFFGSAMNYIIRININIAIVDMISSEFKGGKSAGVSECYDAINATNATFFDTANNTKVNWDERTFVSLERRLLDFTGVCCCDWAAFE